MSDTLIQNVELRYELYRYQVRSKVVLPLADDDPLALEIIQRELKRPREPDTSFGPISL